MNVVSLLDPRSADRARLRSFVVISEKPVTQTKETACQ